MKAVTLGGGRGGERREGKGGGEEERGRRRREEPFFKGAGPRPTALLLGQRSFSRGGASLPAPPPAKMLQTLPTRHSGSGPGRAHRHWGLLGTEGEPSIWGRGTVC